MSRSTIVPTYRYRDVEAAMAFLIETFGFEAHGIDRDGDGRVRRVELRHGAGLVMLGRHRGGWLESRIPDEVGGVTGSTYLVVADVDAHFHRARAAGALIARPLEDTDYGSREYSAWDLEGHLWHFGDYDPFGSHEQARDDPHRRRRRDDPPP